MKLVINLIKAGFPLLFMAWLTGCSATNPAVESLFDEAVALQNKKNKLEKKYFILLGHLQKFPNERPLRLQQAELKQEITALKVQIEENRQQLNLSIKQWEDAVSEKRTEELLIQQEESQPDGTVRRRRRRAPTP